MRAFIAIEMPASVRAAIERVQAQLKQNGFKVRWVRVQNIHLTLKFLGDIKTAEIEKIAAALGAAAKAFPPILLQPKGIGVFPGISRARVIWVGLQGRMDLLFGLHKSLAERLALIGFPIEKRPFKGHLTLGRVKGKLEPNRLTAALKRCRNFATEPFEAERIILFKSDLKPTGAEYTQLTSAGLTGID